MAAACWYELDSSDVLMGQLMTVWVSRHAISITAGSMADVPVVLVISRRPLNRAIGDLGGHRLLDVYEWPSSTAGSEGL